MFEKEVKFIKEFISPVYGNVYLGKTIHVKSAEAEKLIKHGMAEMVLKAEKPKAKVVEEPKAEVEEVENANNRKPRRGKKSFKGR